MDWVLVISVVGLSMVGLCAVVATQAVIYRQMAARLSSLSAESSGHEARATAFRTLYEEKLVDVRNMQQRFDEMERRLRHEFDARDRRAAGTIRELTERIVRLKRITQADAVEDGEQVPLQTGEEIRPYSIELHGFLSGLDSDEARQFAEDFVELHRSEGRDDDQILRMLSNGEYQA